VHSSRSRPDHRYVVVGCGDLGAAASYWLSRAVGGRVLALERDALGDRAGPGRILRWAQHADADADLAAAAHATWRDVERVSAQSLLTETGGLVIEDLDARPYSATGTIGGYAAVADRHDVDFEVLDARAVRARWPQFRLAGSEVAFYQRRTGIVDTPRAHATHLALARGHGAELREHATVRALHRSAGHVEVVLDDEVIRAEHVVVTADTGTNEVVAGLTDPLPLTVTRAQVTSYATPHLLDFAPTRFPVFTWRGADDYSGLPVHGDVATTLAQDLDRHEAESADDPDPLWRKRQEAFLAEHLPGFLGPERHTATCATAAAPDARVVLDTLPGEPRVSVAVGAGHASTFTSLIGRILADIATTGATRHPIGAFGLDRPALTYPTQGGASRV
jgi:sarcosine oxidase